MTPLVSVCIPAFNAAKYIDYTIQSVLNQSYKNIELIICNDGSTDGTTEALYKYASINNIVIVHKSQKGQCAAANEAYKHAKGDFIKFFDADDIMNEEHVASQVADLLQHPNCISAGQVKRFYNDDINTALHEPLGNWKDLPPIEWLVNDNGHGLGMMQCGMFLIPKDILAKAGGWDESLSQINDFEFFPRLLLNAEQVIFTENAKVFYRSGRPNSLSNNLSKAKLISAHTALSLTTKRLLDFENSDRVKYSLSVFWNLWKYNFYIDAMDLYKDSVVQLKRLGNYPDFYLKKNGGHLIKILGWKWHKRLKYLLINRKIEDQFG